MINWLAQTAGEFGDRIALIYENQIWTFAELETQASQIARKLLVSGVKPKAVVGIFMDNHSNLVLLIHALCQLNCIIVPINTRLTAHEISWQLQDCKVNVLICNDAKSNLVKELSANLQYLTIEDIIENTRRLQNSMSQPVSLYNLEDVQTIIYTSGTTGYPKGVQLTYGNHYYSAIAVAAHLKITESDRWLNCLPLFHIGGLSIIWRSLIWGIPMILQARFDVAELCQAIANQQITLVSLVPTMLVRILASPEFKQTIWHWQNLKGILLGGAAPSQTLIWQCLEFNLPIMPTYGLTEAASQVTTLLPQALQRKLNSSGQPLSCDRLRIVDNQERDLATGEIGQILIQGTNVMKGYVNHCQTAVKSGWLYTGDLGYLDPEGYLYIVNRRNDLIISGGENIYPSEIEAILFRHPQIHDVCVIGIDDPEWGQIVGAIVQKNQDQNQKAIALTEIQEFCLEHHLARYKLPKALYLVDHLPRTITGKLLRQEVGNLLRSKIVAQS